MGILSLFSRNDPISSNIGRGALSALGVGLPLSRDDVAIRINFCTVDTDGNIADRRAGRIPTELNEELVDELSSIELDGASFDFVTESQHRAVLVLHGPGLNSMVRETDPQRTGVPPAAPDPLEPENPLRRLVVAQDTGGAIRGAVRGDLFWGAGADAEERAGRMRSLGRYYVLLPARPSRTAGV